jgi:predicted nuclease of predicted toxin-antitoxin system
MRFLVDEQLPAALARWITAQGYVSEHVLDLALGGAKDGAVWKAALERSAVIVTKDEDFPQLARSHSGPSVIWIVTGNMSRRDLLQKMERAFPIAVAALNAGERIVQIS